MPTVVGRLAARLRAALSRTGRGTREAAAGGRAGSARLGAEAEARAAGELARRGYRIVERNWRCRAGEIDIVARDGDALCFVEVRARSRADYGHPLATIGPRKRERLRRAARAYLRARRLAAARVRFDCVSIAPDEVRLVRGAFL